MRFPFFPFLIFLVLLVAIAPAWPFVFAAAGFFLPWVIFGAIIWAIVGSHRERRRWRVPGGNVNGRGWWLDDEWQGWQTPPTRRERPPRYARGAAQWGAQPAPGRSRPEPRAAQPKPAPAPSATPGRRELPIDVLVKVEQIKRKASILERYADRFPPYSQDLYLVRQTTADYLPRTIEAFQALPAEQVERVVPGTGRTAHQELLAQLDLLDGKLDDIARDLQRQDTDRLVANRRFLEMRLDPHDDAPAEADTSVDPTTDLGTPGHNGVDHSFSHN